MNTLSSLLKFIASGGLWSLTYPVGSYYETSDASFDPNVAWGGTWVLEAAGQVHISAGTGYTIGDTGGATTSATGDHTLTTTEIPAHTHGSRTVSYAFTARRQGSNYQSIFPQSNVSVTASSGTKLTSTEEGLANQNTDYVSLSATHTHDSVGGSGSHNHGSVSTMQPYIVVNRWHRTA